MKKFRLMIVILFSLGISCFLIFNIIGSHVEPDGTLVEPFFLVPIGFLFIFSGTIFSIIFGVKSLLKR